MGGGEAVKPSGCRPHGAPATVAGQSLAMVAEIELNKAADAIGQLQEVVRLEATNLKHAKKLAHDAATKAEETERAEAQAASADGQGAGAWGS